MDWQDQAAGAEELSFGISNQEEAVEVPAEGVRRPGRLGVEERRRVAQRLAEAVKANEGDITSKGGGSGRRGLFGADYVPVQGGKAKTRLPFAVLRPMRRAVPQQPAVQQCPDHDRPACPACLVRRRGVRNCCRLGHHEEDYVPRSRPDGICPPHSKGRCERCKVNKRGVLYCCGMGHHGAERRKPGPRVGSKRGASEGGAALLCRPPQPRSGSPDRLVASRPG